MAHTAGHPEISKTAEKTLDEEIDEFEQEICSEDEEFESSLKLKQDKCSKNPGHKDYVSVREFEMSHLPPEWRDPWVSEQIQEVVPPVVRLTINYTSPARPDGYAFDSLRGTRKRRVGTGTAILDPSLMICGQTCPIENCPRKDESPHIATACFKVLTAAHVVFDTSEARHTKIRFFMDSESSHMDDLLEAEGVECISAVGLKYDKTIMVCVSHTTTKFDKFRSRLLVRNVPRNPVPKANYRRQPLVVIISHPHGRSKHVSFGEWKEVKLIDLDPIAEELRASGLKETIDAIEKSYQDKGDSQNVCLLLTFYGFLPRHPRYGTILSQMEHIQNLCRVKTLNTSGGVSCGVLTKPCPSNHFGEECDEQQQQFKLSGQRKVAFHSRRMVYSTVTCPGCSGAPVLVFFEQDDSVQVCCIGMHFGTTASKNVSGIITFPTGGSSFTNFVTDLENNEQDLQGYNRCTTLALRPKSPEGTKQRDHDIVKE